LYLIKEFQRLKEEENRRLSLQWSLHRTLAKVNYRIHTDAIYERRIYPDGFESKRTAFETKPNRNFSTQIISGKYQYQTAKVAIGRAKTRFNGKIFGGKGAH
jgi:hypothetical protein